MALYGETKIKIEALQRWVDTLSADGIEDIEVGGENFELFDISKEMLKNQLSLFAAAVHRLKPSDDWRDTLYCLSPFGYNAFLKAKNGAIRIANYYECLIKPGNSKTYKRIIKGYDYLDIGEVRICDGDRLIASIGQKSDLIWQVFFDYFINRDEPGQITHTHSNHEKYMSIQLFDIEDKTQEEIDAIINEILLRTSIEYDLDFKIVELDANYLLEGEASTYHLQFHEIEYEFIPSLYFNNGVHSNDVRLAYLSFYQVIEYFFVRAQNYAFIYEYNRLPSTIDHSMLRKVLQKYKNSMSERESLKLVLKKAIDITDFKTWVSSNAECSRIYCSESDYSIDLSKSDDKIINKIVERIYSYRCSIAHAKGDVDEYIAIPSLSNDDIKNEIPLVKYIAFKVLKRCSQI